MVQYICVQPKWRPMQHASWEQVAAKGFEQRKASKKRRTLSLQSLHVDSLFAIMLVPCR
jgi:hypothetical protein